MRADRTSQRACLRIAALLSLLGCRVDGATDAPTEHTPTLVASASPVDGDHDGFVDASDACPGEPGIEPDGCPIRDDDGDGVLNTEDQCPEECEVVNGIDDGDGCADQHPSEREEVQAILGSIEGLYFSVNKSEIKPKSFAVLDNIVEVLQRNPEVRVYIDGHTDSRGSDRYSRRRLDRRRADSVRAYLVDKGVDAGRLSSRGFGEDKPIASNKTEEGRALNRRIELVLMDSSGARLKSSVLETCTVPQPTQVARR